MMQLLHKTLLRSGASLELRAVTPADEPFLLSVYESTRAEELAQAEWAPGQQEAFLKWQFDMQRQEYSARFPDAEHNLVLVNGDPAGRIWIGQDERQVRLLDIALLPEYQNQGVGTILLRSLMAVAELEGKPLRHMVFMLNNDAHRFYKRLGFVVIEDMGAYKHMEYRRT